jgi:cell division protein FtsQ
MGAGRSEVGPWDASPWDASLSDACPWDACLSDACPWNTGPAGSSMSKRPSNSVTDRPSRWKLILRRQRRFLRPAAWLGFTLLVLGLGTVVVRATDPAGTIVTFRDRLGGATAMAGLRITDVVIEGRANTPEPLLRAALGVRQGDPILGFSVEQARKRIEELTWVEQATVERRLPNTVVVFLKERRPFAIWQNQGKFVLIDRAGDVVDNQEVAQFRHLPLVVGAGAPLGAAALLDALATRPALTGRIMAAVRVAERRWNLRMKSGTDVLLPEGHEAAALDRLIQLHQSQALLDRPLAAIDLRLPDKLVIRPRPAGAGDATTAGAPTVPTSSKKPI